ncbi:MAG: putative hydrolase of the superfamily [Actinomycetota bacterium]|nr:putative hydrolase of the superfamily [Actinomycetota bacterium]
MSPAGTTATAAQTPLALIVDWGGVLTNDLASVMTSWTSGEDFEAKHFAEVMTAWFGRDAGLEAAVNPILALERGELAIPDFELVLAEALTEVSSTPVPPAGLLDRLFGHFQHAHDMTGLVHRARDSGLKTALLSNSWGDHYPDHLFDGMFDAVVISGRVGMRKPEPEIFHYTCSLLGLAPRQCVFVDDLKHNIEAADRLGFSTVHHLSYGVTASELSEIFGRDLNR